MRPTENRDRRPHIALKYVTRFRCLGSACEDTCCSGWTVHVSERDYRNAERAVSGCKADRERFHRSFERSGDETNTGSTNVKPGPPNHDVTGEPSERFRRSFEGRGDETGAGAGPPEQGAGGEPGHWLEGEPRGEERADVKGYARIRMRADTDRCPWLEDGLCALQSRYGASALPDVCMVYPRILSETPHSRETAGCLSCPEMARELLLHDDACSWVTDAPPLTDRRHVVQTQAAAVDRALVEVMYLTARTYEHSPAFLQRIGERIRAAGFENLAGSVLLLKF